MLRQFTVDFRPGAGVVLLADMCGLGEKRGARYRQFCALTDGVELRIRACHS